MEHIYRGLPSLMRAQKIQSKAAKAGFDWPDVSGAMDKLSEEQAELTQALAGADRARILDEAGDLLFACVNVVRHAGLDSEEARPVRDGQVPDAFHRKRWRRCGGRRPAWRICRSGSWTAIGTA